MSILPLLVCLHVGLMGIHWQKSHNDVFQYFVLLHDNKSVCVHKVMFHCHVSPIGSEKPNTVSSARPFMLTAATVVPPKQDEVNSVFCLSHVYLKQKKKSKTRHNYLWSVED